MSGSKRKKKEPKKLDSSQYSSLDQISTFSKRNVSIHSNSSARKGILKESSKKSNIRSIDSPSHDVSLY